MSRKVNLPCWNRTEITGWEAIAKKMAEGMVRKKTSFKEEVKVSTNSPISFLAAYAEMMGKVTVATATPNTPMGNCISRKL